MWWAYRYTERDIVNQSSAVQSWHDKIVWLGGWCVGASVGKNSNCNSGTLNLMVCTFFSFEFIGFIVPTINYTLTVGQVLIQVTKFSVVKGFITSVINMAPCVSSIGENPFAGQSSSDAKIAWLVVERKSVVLATDYNRFYCRMRLYQHLRPKFRDWFIGIEVHYTRIFI